MSIHLSASCVKIWHQKQTQLSRSVLWLEPTELVMPWNTPISGGPLIPKPVTKGSLPWSRGVANYLEWSFSSFVGREERKKKMLSPQLWLFPCWLGLQNRCSRKWSLGLASWKRVEKKVRLCHDFHCACRTDWTGTQEPAFSEAFHMACFPLRGANNQGLLGVASCTGQGQTLVEWRPRLITFREQWTLTLDPWRAVFLWNLWRGHWYYWSILLQIRSWQQIHLLMSLA